MEARASPAGITISLAASGFLPASAVEHTDELVGRGASGVDRKGTIQPKGGGPRLPVAIKELDGKFDQIQSIISVSTTLSSATRASVAGEVVSPLLSESTIEAEA